MTALRKTYTDALTAAEACGAHILARLQSALSVSAWASLALSGGTSPKPMFRYLSRADFDWSRVRIFWVDERSVSPSSDQSNFRLVEECLLEPAKIPEHNVFRIRGELPPQQAAVRYIADLKQSLVAPDNVPENAPPAFDVIHLGVGADAHTASLFPGEPLIEDSEQLAAAVYVEKIPQWRITLLPSVLLAARDIAVLATGGDKAPALSRVFREPYSPREYPAQLIAQRAAHSTWFIDAAASEDLT